MKKLLLAAVAWLLTALAGPALASNCSPFPYTLSNGTTADATQVMADLNTLLTCANSNLAHNGTNADITSLNTLSTPLSAAQGGTGNTVGSASKLTTPFTLTLSGFASGSASIDGSTGVTLTTTSTPAYATIQNQQAQNVGSSGSGTNMEILSNGSFATVTLNTAVNNTITGATLSSNLVSLPAGTYRVLATVPVFTGGSNASSQTNIARCRLQNTTDAATLLLGTPAQAYNADNATWNNQGGATVTVSGYFTLAATKNVALQCGSFNQTSGSMGVGVVSPLNYTGVVETYETLAIEKIG